MSILSDIQKPRIQAWAKTAAHPVSLGYAVTGHPQDASFKAFATELADLAGCLKIKKDADTQADRPSLLIGGHVIYQAFSPGPGTGTLSGRASRYCHMGRCHVSDLCLPDHRSRAGRQ